jgi:hypothetical protein
MNTFKFLSLAAAVAVIGFIAAAPQAQAQIDVDTPLEPMCPYGYYDYAPYACAPYGYYGPEWFTGGLFLGAGPWLHGHEGFRGSEDHRFDASRGDGRDHAGAMEYHGGGHEGGFEGGHAGGFQGGHEGGGGGGHEGGGGGGHGGGGGGHR